MQKESKNENEMLIQKLRMLEERIKRLESAVTGQSKLIREQSVYITHLRKKTKKI